MEDQQKPKPTKQVRVRARFFATIEVVENDEVIHVDKLMTSAPKFDQQGFQEAFQYFDVARLAKETELKDEFEQEQKAKQESERSVLQSAFTKLVSIFS